MLATVGWVGVGRNKTDTGAVDGGTITAAAVPLSEAWALKVAGPLTIAGIARQRSGARPA